MKDDLGNRMKLYEKSDRSYLTPRTPIILRIDGKTFSTWTKHLTKPFDSDMDHIMNLTSIKLCEEIQGAKAAYVQSDEISILIHSYEKFNTSPWFDNQIQKIVSVSASIASTTFMINALKRWNNCKPAYFDARVFCVPENDVCNYFLWRQKDATRNSVQSLARSLYSHKDCNNKNTLTLKQMCIDANSPWENLHNHLQLGRFIYYGNDKVEYLQECNVGFDNSLVNKWRVSKQTPNFKENREIINSLLKCQE